jgi:hypothetical protein
MRRRVPFWGIVLIVLGVLLLLENLNVFGDFDVWGVFWPLLLIGFGVWVLLGVFYRGRPAETEQASIPLEGASEARIKIRHGAGRLTVGAGAGSDVLASGDFAGGLDYEAHRDGDALDVTMNTSASVWGIAGFPLNLGSGGGLDWNVRLNDRIPLAMKLETGASDTALDLEGLRVTDLKVETGASATRITLPANAGHTQVKVSSGAASVSIRVPEGVAARIRVESGLAGITIDRDRFPRAEGVYQSPDYETAANKADIKIETGVGSVDVR